MSDPIKGMSRSVVYKLDKTVKGMSFKFAAHVPANVDPEALLTAVDNAVANALRDPNQLALGLKDEGAEE